MNESISNHQINKLFDNKCRCISYDELHNYRTLKSLLHPYGFAIVLYVWDDIPTYNGHWVYIGYGKNKDKNKIILFDSLGHDDIDLNKKVDLNEGIDDNTRKQTVLFKRLNDDGGAVVVVDGSKEERVIYYGELS